MIFFKKNGKGILFCLIISLIINYVVQKISILEIVGAPVLAILTGMIFSIIIKDKSKLESGIQFTSKKILQYAIVLLGFGLNLTMIGKVGLISLPIIVCTITTSLVISYLLQKILKIPVKISILIGVGSAVCGGSAIAATAPVIDADDKEISQSISVIFLFNVIAAIVFPLLGAKLGLSDTGFGLFAGTAINDTSSVTAAASTWDTLHNTNGSVLAYATIVKLTRTLAIIPITLILSFLHEYNNTKNNTNKSYVISQKSSITKIFPMFILYFVGASLFTTIVTNLFTGQILTISFSVFSVFKHLSKFFIIMAMCAIGLNSDLKEMIKNSGKPIILGFCCWISISIASMLLQHFLGLI